jgi:hypothetical protein
MVPSTLDTHMLSIGSTPARREQHDSSVISVPVYTQHTSRLSSPTPSISSTSTYTTHMLPPLSQALS